jgi:hypothetical protein
MPNRYEDVQKALGELAAELATEYAKSIKDMGFHSSERVLDEMRLLREINHNPRLVLGLAKLVARLAGDPPEPEMMSEFLPSK